jgi:hypothetical protein
MTDSVHIFETDIAHHGHSQVYNTCGNSGLKIFLSKVIVGNLTAPQMVNKSLIVYECDGSLSCSKKHDESISHSHTQTI